MSGEIFRDELLAGRIAVCVGCGGVGKTTVAASLALAAARAGRHALVITIDPARRLADALGVELSDEPRRIEDARVGLTDGSLSALMLDMKRTFDDLVDRLAESDEARERIFSNAIYQHVSDALAGSAEYSAMEKVYQMAAEGDYDFIVVDTPPAQHALDFLEAPQRMLDFLDSRLVSGLIHPAFAAGRLGFKVFQRGAKRVLQLIERVSGVGFIEDISEFLLAFEGMADGFRDRASRVRELMLGSGTSFILVTGPAHESVDQARSFLERLEAYQVPLLGVVANRVREWPEGVPPQKLDPEGPDTKALAAALAGTQAGTLAEEAARAAVEAAAGYAALVRRDEAALGPVREHTEAGGRFYRQIPELSEDVHDLESLDRIAHYVFERG
jgi:anion-transporting  ArsA/GET3 family ATPase